MARFLDQVITGVEDNRDQGKHVLKQTVIYESDILGRIEVPEGFGTDFASVPRWLPCAYALLSGHGDSAATVHDFAYTFQFCTRLEADRMLREALRVTGVSEWRVFLFYWGVRLFGWSHWIPAQSRLRSGRP